MIRIPDTNIKTASVMKPSAGWISYGCRFTVDVTEAMVKASHGALDTVSTQRWTLIGGGLIDGPHDRTTLEGHTRLCAVRTWCPWDALWEIDSYQNFWVADIWNQKPNSVCISKRYKTRSYFGSSGERKTW